MLIYVAPILESRERVNWLAYLLVSFWTWNVVELVVDVDQINDDDKKCDENEHG